MNVANKLIALRKQQNWTQAQAAKIIDIQQSYLSKLENGRHIPSEEVVQKLCSAYQVSERELLADMPRASRFSPLAFAAFIFAVMLILAGQFKLFFEETYYTYKLSADLPSGVLMPVTEVTDEYLGDSFTLVEQQRVFEYQLIAERDISRIENRWLSSVGLLLVIAIAVYKTMKTGLILADKAKRD